MCGSEHEPRDGLIEILRARHPQATEAVVAAAAGELEAWYPGQGRAIAQAISDWIESRVRTKREAAGAALHVEIALDFDVDPDDPDAELFGPGGWRIDCGPELHAAQSRSTPIPRAATALPYSHSGHTQGPPDGLCANAREWSIRPLPD